MKALTQQGLLLGMVLALIAIGCGDSDSTRHIGDPGT